MQSLHDLPLSCTTQREDVNDTLQQIPSLTLEHLTILHLQIPSIVLIRRDFQRPFILRTSQISHSLSLSFSLFLPLPPPLTPTPTPIPTLTLLPFLSPLLLFPFSSPFFSFSFSLSLFLSLSLTFSLLCITLLCQPYNLTFYICLLKMVYYFECFSHNYFKQSTYLKVSLTF